MGSEVITPATKCCSTPSGSGRSPDWISQQTVEITLRPVALDDGAEAKIFDSGTPVIEKLTQRTAFGHQTQPPRSYVCALLDWGAQMRGGQCHHMAKSTHPAMPGLSTCVQGTARHETTHRMAHQGDFFHGNGPSSRYLVDQRG